MIKLDANLSVVMRDFPGSNISRTKGMSMGPSLGFYLGGLLALRWTKSPHPEHSQVLSRGLDEVQHF